MEGFLSGQNGLSSRAGTRTPAHSGGMNAYVCRKADTDVRMFTAALSTITQTGKHPLVSVGSGMEKLGSVHSREGYTAVKNKHCPAQHGERHGHNVEPDSVV